MINAVETTPGHRLEVLEVARRPGDPAITVASNDKAADVLGWRPRLGLGEMVADAWQFHQHHAS